MPAASVYDSTMYTTTVFKNCVFKKNTATTTRTFNCIKQYSGTVGVSAKNYCKFTSILTFEDCTFTENQGLNVVTVGDYVFSSSNLTIIDQSTPCDPTLTVSDASSESESEGGCDYDDGPPQREKACQGFHNESIYDCYQGAANQSRPLADLQKAYMPFHPMDFLSTSSPAYLSIVKVRPHFIQHRSNSTSKHVWGSAKNAAILLLPMRAKASVHDRPSMLLHSSTSAAVGMNEMMSCVSQHSNALM
jgi:hypothetical protein